MTPGGDQSDAQPDPSVLTVVAAARAAGVELAPDAAAAVLRLTCGWPPALDRTLRRLAGSADPEAEIRALALRPVVVADLLAERLASGPAELAALVADLARAQPLTDALCAEAGLPVSVDALRAAGLPVTVSPDGSWGFPEPARTLLRDRQQPDAAVLGRLADALVGRSDPVRAIDLLIASGRHDRAAALLARLPAADVERFELAELRHTVSRLDARAVDDYPEVWLQLAHLAEKAAAVEERRQALERAARRAKPGSAAAHAVEAEIVFDLARDGHTGAVRERVTALLDADPPPAVRARALSGLGRAAAFERTEASLAEAAQVLEEAARLQGALGLVGDRVSSLLALGVSVHQAAGRLAEALRTLDAATDLLPGRSRQRAAVLTFRADARRLADRPRDAEADAREAFAVGVALDDPRSAGYAAWVLIDLAAEDGDATGVRRWTEEMLRYPGDWFGHPSGIEALVAAADAHDRVGAQSEARDLLAQAWERSRADPRYAEIPLFAEAAIMARHGDPAVAADLLAQAMASPELPARERWRVLLLDGLAALRRGDAQTAGRRAASAFDRAEALGTLARVSRVERLAASRLVGLAADAGSPAAARHAGAVAGWITVLGRFAVDRAGGPLDIPEGQPALLVKLLAVHGGRLHVDAVLDRLWPAADPEVGRRRLRNLLNRLTSAAPGLIVRAGDRLALAEGTGIDVQRFLDLGRSALRAPAADAPAAQRAALAAYTGPLLPDDRDEEALWEPREQVRRLHLALLDALAGHAETTGEPDEAAALLTIAFEADPADAPRAHQLAALLSATGRDAAARVALDRHRRALCDLAP